MAAEQPRDPAAEPSGASIDTVLLVAGLVEGGVGRHVAQLAQGLHDRGIGVGVACPDVVAARFGLREFARVHPVEIGSRPQPLRDRTAVQTLREVVPTYAVVHAHGLRAGALSALASEPLEKRKVPLVVTTHNAAPQGRLAAVVHQGLERMVCRNADAVLGVSQDLIAHAAALGAERVDRAVVAALRAQPARGADAVRAELDIPQDQVLVVSVGRLAAQKGFDRMLDMLVEVLGVDPAVPSAAGSGPGESGERAAAGAQLPPFRVVIAGDGPQRDHLQRRIDRFRLPVQLLGRREDVADLLGAADLTLSTARWEGQPVWLQEALSVGAPILASDVGGTAEVIGAGGMLIDPELPGAFAAEFRRALREPGRRADLAQAARHRAAELPTAQDAVEAALVSYGRAVAAALERGVD